MNEKNLIVYKSNNLIESCYKLSLTEQRVLLACIGQINSSEPLAISDQFELSAKDFSVIFGTDAKSAYTQLVEVSENLYKRELIVEKPSKGIKKLKTRWITSISYQDNCGGVVLRFAQDLLPYLSELKEQFTKYDLASISGMTSIYGIRLYELLMQWQSTGKRDISIEWLKQVFEIENNYSSISDLKKYVIEPAVANVNKHSNINVTHTYKKTGRNVTHILFQFKLKPVKKPQKLSKPKPEPVKVTIDNLDYFEDVRKKYGDKAPIPADIEAELKRLGRWK
jgi:plasmid replication initiation protein